MAIPERKNSLKNSFILFVVKNKFCNIDYRVNQCKNCS